MRALLDQAFVTLQMCLPTTLLSSLMHKLANSEIPWLKRAIIQGFMSAFGIKLDEADQTDPDAYPSFNAFFTRALAANARPVDCNAGIVSPVDGGVSQLGPVRDGTLIQAKGLHYDVESLLGGADLAAPFLDGQFATLYLSPRDYHRIHMPVDGKLIGSHYVPGRLFAVNPPTVRTLPGVFARNERLTLVFQTADGPMAMVLVGALFVGSIQTVFDGKVTPPHKGSAWSHEHAHIPVARGDEVGRFNMGSTVIMLTTAQAPKWLDTLKVDDPVRMGRALTA